MSVVFGVAELAGCRGLVVGAGLLGVYGAPSA